MIGDGPEMIRRVAAAQATLDAFKDKPLKLGERDCVQMVAFHLRRLGHRVKLPPKGSYRTRKTAVCLLAERGHADLAAAVDALGLEVIAPAAALVGDILQLPAVDELGALTIAMGNGRVVGYHEHAAGAVVMQPRETIRAWRVLV